MVVLYLRPQPVVGALAAEVGEDKPVDVGYGFSASQGAGQIGALHRPLGSVPPGVVTLQLGQIADEYVGRQSAKISLEALKSDGRLDVQDADVNVEALANSLGVHRAPVRTCQFGPEKSDRQAVGLLVSQRCQNSLARGHLLGIRT